METPTALTTTQFAMLGLLVDTPRHGYELDALVAGVGLRSWVRLSPSSIYFVLQRLAERGLIAPTAPGGGGRRQQFQITAQGAAVLRARVESCLVDAEQTREDFKIAVVLAPVLEPDVVRAALDARLRAMQERLVADEARTEERRGANPLADQVRARDLDLLRADLAWVQGCADEVVRLCDGGLF